MHLCIKKSIYMANTFILQSCISFDTNANTQLSNFSHIRYVGRITVYSFIYSIKLGYYF